MIAAVLPDPGRATRPARAQPEALLRQAEIRGERMAALFRIIIFLTLLLVVGLTDGGLHRFDISFWTALYGVGTLVGLLLAWQGVFHPAIAYGFATFDIVLVAIQLLLLTRAIGMPPTHSLAMPVAALVFVIMVHAAMRYRPWLVIYAAGLFVLTIQAAVPFFTTHDNLSVPVMAMHHGDAPGEFLLFQVLPITIIGLCAVILFVTVQRTRRLLLESIRHADRGAKLARYFSPELGERLAAGSDEHLLAGSRQRAAALFVDLRGFTALAEAMDPRELGTFLSQFRSRLSRPVFAHAGTIDKFIGDAIMAVFGAPLQRPDDGRRAVLCALEMIETTARWSEERQRAGLPAVAVGIGGHYGEVFAGVLGDERLLEYTVIGDTVNVAERLEQLTRRLDSPLVVSASLLAAAGASAAAGRWQHLNPQALPGHTEAVEAFALAAFESPLPDATGFKRGSSGAGQGNPDRKSITMNASSHPRDLGADGPRAWTTRRGFVAAMSLAGVSLYGLWAAYGAAPLVFRRAAPDNGHGRGDAAPEGLGHGGHGAAMTGPSPEEFRRLVDEFIARHQLPDGSVAPDAALAHESPAAAEGAQHAPAHGAGHGAHGGAPPTTGEGPGEAHGSTAALVRDEVAAATAPVEVYLAVQQWLFEPTVLRLRPGVPYRFRIMALDVSHGASLQLGRGSHIIRLRPGVMAERELTFTRPGEYLVYCTVYCGLGHDHMSATIIVA